MPDATLPNPSPPPSPAQPKICIRCGQDCSGKPRTKDERGRYTCRACFDAAASQRRVAGTSTAPRPAATAPRSVAASDDPPAPSEEPGGYSLIDDLPAAAATGSSGAGEGAAGGAGGGAGGPCPECGTYLPPSAMLCVSCGFSRAGGAAGRRLRTVTGTEKPAKVPRDVERAQAKHAHRMEYLKPVIMFVASFAVIAGVLIAKDQGAAIPVMLLAFGVNVVIGLVMFWVCTLVYVDYEGPVLLTALRLLGIYGVCEVADLVMRSYFPIPVLRWAVPAFIYVGLLADMLDLELAEAVVVALVTWIVRLFIAIYVLVAIGAI